MFFPCSLIVCSNMEQYLRDCRENLKNLDVNAVVQVVLGSEACDLDSAVSSLVLAYFYHKTQSSADLVVPLLNVERKDLKLHTEVTFFLEETSVPLDVILCKDELDLKVFANRNKLQLVLVDHNVLSVEDSYLEPCVYGVIDHHVPEHPDRSDRCSTKIELVGSCCTLVADEVLKSSTSILDPQIAMLLYGTILLDTVCLEESAKRTTPKDIDVVSKLESMLDGISREEVFETLQKAKFSISGLSAEQLLYKDLKIVTSDSASIAISSLPVLLQNCISDSSMESALIQFCCEKQLISVILMGSEVTPDKKSVNRQIAVFSPNPDLLEKISKFLRNLQNPSLELEPLPTKSASLLAFDQRNSSLSRKFVLPAIRKFLTENSDLSGLVKYQLAQKENMNSDFIQDVEPDLLADGETEYHAETLDFPDSPKHSNLLKISLEILDQNSRDDVNAVEFSRDDVNAVNPNMLNLENGIEDGVSTPTQRKKISVTPDILRSDVMDDDQRSLSSLSNKSDLDVFSPMDDVILSEDIDTLVEDFENSECIESPLSEPIPEISAAEEYEEERSWKTCIVNGEERKIDMKVIEPYKKVLSHGGYYGASRNAIIIFSACYLPDRSRKDYDYVMDNLFLYVLTTLDQLVAEDYILVYLHGATDRGNMPSFGWLKRCYQMIDRRLRKNLKGLYLVHPTFWLKTIVIMTKPFISSKFSRKLKFVGSLSELSNLIPMDHVCIPDKVKQVEFQKMIKEKKKLMKTKGTIPGPMYISHFDTY